MAVHGVAFLPFRQKMFYSFPCQYAIMLGLNCAVKPKLAIF